MSGEAPAASTGPALKVLALALLVAIGSGIAVWALGAAQQLSNEGRAELPGTVEFAGEARSYDVFISPRATQGSNTPERISGQTDCAVEADGDRLATIDGARQATRRVTSFGASVGSFEGRAGRIAVRCAVNRSLSGVTNRFVVAKDRGAVRYAAYGGFAVAAVLLLAGLLLLRRAMRA